MNREAKSAILLTMSTVKEIESALVELTLDEKQAVKFNIPEAEAVNRLKDLIREHGKWVEPEQKEAMAQSY